MLEYYEEVSGCYVIRPLAFSIWQEIQSGFTPVLLDTKNIPILIRKYIH